MAFNPIPDPVRKLWDAWGIRGVILLSLSLQILLIFFAPLRKKTSNSVILFIIWAAYLLADWTAAFAVGLISNSQGQKDSSSASTSPNNSDLLAFWAPFLLVHLGGPDTITALVLEDNAIWLRHLIGLLLQFSAAVYVFLLTLPDSKLYLATIAMLVAGLIKYAERTRALYLASLDKFKESMLEKRTIYVDVIELSPGLPSPTQIIVRERALISKSIRKDEADVVKHAQHFFEKFKGLIVDLIANSNDQNDSRAFFMARNSRDALRVILVELNFMYEVFYTKAVVVHSWWGSAFRFVAFALESVALVLFIRAKKSSFHSFDVRITFVLLISAISLDLIATFVVIFSDWLVATVRNNSVEENKVVAQLDKYISPISSYFLKWSTPSYTTCGIGVVDNFKVGNTFVLNRRWAESISAYNLIGICLKESPRKIGKPMGWFGRLFYNIFCCPLCIVEEVLSFIGWQIMPFFFGIYKQIASACGDTSFCGKPMGWLGRLFYKTGLPALYEDIRYVVRNPFVLDLWDFIFHELKAKSELAEDSKTAKQIFEWVLRYRVLGPTVERLRIDAAEYDRSLLLWHIATEICYHLEKPEEDENRDEDAKKKKEYSKILSDYMLYLLEKQPSMMSSVAGIGQVRFRDTRADVEKFFNGKSITTMKANPKEKMKQGCVSLHGLMGPDLPAKVVNGSSKTVLFDAIMLANEMMHMKDTDKWEVMSKVWVEHLAYAASHSRADTHAQLLSKGGELITFVWLLLAHFRPGEKIADELQFARENNVKS